MVFNFHVLVLSLSELSLSLMNKDSKFLQIGDIGHRTSDFQLSPKSHGRTAICSSLFMRYPAARLVYMVGGLWGDGVGCDVCCYDCDSATDTRPRDRLCLLKLSLQVPLERQKASRGAIGARVSVYG